MVIVVVCIERSCMDELNQEALLALLDALGDEQALWEERAYITSRLSTMYTIRASEVERSIENVQSLLARLAEAERLHGRG
jgi:hypothetical protein